MIERKKFPFQRRLKKVVFGPIKTCRQIIRKEETH
jgi:hypothetical protein